MSAPQPRSPAAGPDRHSSAADYEAFLRRYPSPHTVAAYRGHRARFVRRYPDLGAWFAAPLAERVGRLHGEGRAESMTCVVSYRARPYLYFLARQGDARLDYPWLLAVHWHGAWHLLADTPLPAAAAALAQDAVRLGYDAAYAEDAARWVLGRVYLHTGLADLARLEEAELAALAAAARAFGQRPDVADYYGSAAAYARAHERARSFLHLVGVVLYHRGRLAAPPRVAQPPRPPAPAPQPRLAATAARYLAARRAQDTRPSTLANLDLALRRFGTWLAAAHPEVASFAEVTRAHVQEYALALEGMATARTGQPLAPLTRRSWLSALAVFCRDTAAWGWADAPGRPLLGAGDLPRAPRRVPRYIPEGELARLMEAVRALPCPYRRAALLVARWSGARRDEIRRLAAACLDAYPDGTPRLHLPVGKGRAERQVPLHPEAAAAIRAVQALRRADERGLRDEYTGEETRRLFMHHGQLYSAAYLFEDALAEACRLAGLVTADGRPTVTAHRFRHTVGTRLAERGARLHTIMRVLGHTSANMALVYAQISDREVLRDYQAVLGPGAVLAGPAAERLRAGALPPAEVDWLKTNFLKTELELGHCLRLPQEGPCECDLFLTCAKFVTTAAYAPRLRRRRRLEQVLLADARARGWAREAERHAATARRLEHLLAELGEPLEGPEAE